MSIKWLSVTVCVSDAWKYQQKLVVFEDGEGQQVIPTTTPAPTTPNTPTKNVTSPDKPFSTVIPIDDTTQRKLHFSAFSQFTVKVGLSLKYLMSVVVCFFLIEFHKAPDV